MGLEIPAKFGGVKPKPMPHRAECKACGDFGTLAKSERRQTVKEILEHEVPCVCDEGQLWRRIEAEWAKSIPSKGGGKAAA